MGQDCQHDYSSAVKTQDPAKSEPSGNTQAPEDFAETLRQLCEADVPASDSEVRTKLIASACVTAHSYSRKLIDCCLLHTHLDGPFFLVCAT